MLEINMASFNTMLRPWTTFWKLGYAMEKVGRRGSRHGLAVAMQLMYLLSILIRELVANAVEVPAEIISMRNPKDAERAKGLVEWGETVWVRTSGDDAGN